MIKGVIAVAAILGAVLLIRRRRTKRNPYSSAPAGS